MSTIESTVQVPQGTIESGTSGRAHREFLARCEATIRLRPHLPRPGSGRTLDRWRWLAAVGAQDLAVAKIVEAHHDADAILAELEDSMVGDGERWGVWAAEPPDHVVIAYRAEDGGLRLRGAKAWCSGASHLTHALVTVRPDSSDSASAQAGAQGVQLVAVDLAEPGIIVDESGWHAVGMMQVPTARVRFDGVRCRAVGAPGAYLCRPGFWHGGAGIAACWWGGAAAIGQTLHDSPHVDRNPHALAALGEVDTALGCCGALLRELAAQIDADPTRPWTRQVLRVRAATDQAADHVLRLVGRALGANPLCLDAVHAQRCADLAVFTRQHHAQRDAEEQGRLLLVDRDHDGGGIGDGTGDRVGGCRGNDAEARIAGNELARMPRWSL